MATVAMINKAGIMEISSGIVLLLYLYTHYPSVPGGDSGEILAEACQLGTVHPPGYPLFTMLSHIIIQWCRDIISPARAINLFCCTLGTATSYLLSRSIYSFLQQLYPPPSPTTNNNGRIHPTTNKKSNHEITAKNKNNSRKNSLDEKEPPPPQQQQPPNPSTSSSSLIPSPNTTAIQVTTNQFLNSSVSALAGIIFALSPIVWEYSIGTEVFALNNFLVTCVIYCTIQISNISTTKPKTTSTIHDVNVPSVTRDMIQPKWKYYYSGALCSGLALSNQHTSLLFIFPLVTYVLILLFCPPQLLPQQQQEETNDDVIKLEKKTSLCRITVSKFFRLAVCFIVGLSPYLYLPLATQHPKPGSWGDMTSSHGFLRHVMRSEYGTFSLAVHRTDVEGSIGRWYAYIEHVYNDFTPVCLALFFIGMISLIKNIKKVHLMKPTKVQDKNIILKEKEQHANDSKKEMSNECKHASLQKQRKEEEEQQQQQPSEMCHDHTSQRQMVKCGIALFFTFLFYMTVWNGLFSNLPLNIPMAYGVHSRFWMQPDIILSIFIGLGAREVIVFFSTIMMHLIKFRYSMDESSTFLSDEFSYKIQLWIGRFGICISLVTAISRSDFMAIRNNDIRPDMLWLMHDYGTSILNVLPPKSLLLSHTDLNWNTVRYLQVCEDKRNMEDNLVTHISSQLLPFPWFQRQIQHNLYPNVVFPHILHNVSTNRNEVGNAMLIQRFVEANIRTRRFTGGIFLDMQSVKDTDIGVFGKYHHGNFMLLPWGPVYRVIPLEKNSYNFDKSDRDTPRLLSVVRKWHPSIKSKIQETRKIMSRHKLLLLSPNTHYDNYNILSNITDDSEKILIGRQGSWEFAVQSVFWDMHYVSSLHFLTTALAISSTHMKENPDLILSQYNLLDVSCKLLFRVSAIVKQRKTISHVEFDVIKNTALAFMRYYRLCEVVVTLKKHLPKLPHLKPRDIDGIRKRTLRSVEDYLILVDGENTDENKVSDKDMLTFQQFHSKILADDKTKNYESGKGK